LGEYKNIRGEFTYGNSRIDFLLDNDDSTHKKVLVEVKNVVLADY
jgi:DNA-binding sugar fermentation-stimulating protein